MRALIGSGLGQAAIYATALVLSKVVSLAMLPVFTFFLTPEEYGRLDILQTLANLLSLIIGFGLADTLFRFTGAAKTIEEKKEAAAGVLGLAVITFLASLMGFQLAAPWIAELLPGGVSVLQTRLILASLSFTALILVPLSWLRHQDRAPVYFMGSAGRALLQAMLASLLLWWGFGIDGVLIAGFLCASTLCCGLVLMQWRETGVRFSLIMMKRQGRFGGTLLIAGLATFILDSFDRWLLADAVGTTELALYSLAGKVAIMAAFATQPFGLWWYARRFKVLSEPQGEEHCARMTELGILVAMLGALGIVGVGPAVVTWMSPETFHGAIAFIPAMALLASLNEMTTLVNVGVLSNERTTMPIKIDWSAAVVALAGYALFIPAMGAWGAILATVLALTLRFGLYAVFGQRQRRLPYRWGRLLGLAVVVIVTSGLVQASDGIVAPFVVASAGGCLLLVLAAIAGILPLSSIKRPVRMVLT